MGGACIYNDEGPIEDIEEGWMHRYGVWKERIRIFGTLFGVGRSQRSAIYLLDSIFEYSGVPGMWNEYNNGCTYSDRRNYIFVLLLLLCQNIFPPSGLL